MNIPVKFLLVSAIGVALWGSGAALAATPTPTATPATTATPAPSSPQPAIFGGSVWINAHRVSDKDVVAKIGDTVCATERAPLITGPGASGSVYGLSVPSEEVLPGCGREGATISFFVGGQQVAQTAIWHAGERQDLNLMIGPPFARFLGGLDRAPSSAVLVPYIRDKSCGYAGMNPTRDGYEGIVYSAEQQAGCGVEGAEVTFKLLDAQGNVVAIAKEKGVWHAWDGVSATQQLNLTMVPVGSITLANTGTGEPNNEASPWAAVAAVLSLAGLGGLVAGAALRRRVTMR